MQLCSLKPQTTNFKICIVLDLLNARVMLEIIKSIKTLHKTTNLLVYVT